MAGEFVHGEDSKRLRKSEVTVVTRGMRLKLSLLGLYLGNDGFRGAKMAARLWKKNRYFNLAVTFGRVLDRFWLKKAKKNPQA